MEYFKLISIAGLAIELLGIVMLFRHESFNIEEKISAEKLQSPLDSYLEARDNNVKPKTQPALENESNYRAAVRKNTPSKVSIRLKTAYGCLFVGFLFQCAGVLLS